MAFRKEFVDALTLLAAAFDRVVELEDMIADRMGQFASTPSRAPVNSAA